MTMEQTDWADPLPEHGTAPRAEPGATAAASHDAWGGSEWETTSEAPQAAAGAAEVQAPVSAASSDADKAKRKRKANLVIGGIAVALVGVIGTGVAFKMNHAKQRAADEFVAEPMVKAPPIESAHKAPAASIAPQQQQTPQPDIQPAADPMTAKSDLSPSPAGAITPALAPAPMAPAPVAAKPEVAVAAAATDASSLRDLKAKDSALEVAKTELKGQLAALTERVAALESKGQTSSTSERETEQVSRRVNAAHHVKPKQKQLAYDADVVRGKPGAAGAVAKAEPERASNWSSYHTVATYPATGKAEKAWVTNGKGLVVVTVGTEIDGVKVSRLAGTTVYLADGGKINVK